MRTKSIALAVLVISLFSLTACKKDIQIFEPKPITEAQEVTAKSMVRDVFYVKNGTKFSSVFLPNGNAANEAKKLDKTRVLYFIDNEPMVPAHYKGEILAYKSATLDVIKDGISFERYKDLGYSIGVYGGTIGPEGFYYLTISKGTAIGSNAEKVLGYSQVDEIRIVSIGGRSVKEYYDEDSGVLVGLEKDKSYTVEFYVGTEYYSYNFVADTHFLQAYEYYYYEGTNLKDTKLGYVSFTTPDDLKSGYYNVNGTGLFLYHAYEKGNDPENESLNDSYYSSEKEQILQYTRQYNLMVPVETKNMLITVAYGDKTEENEQDFDIGGYLISPEGEVYDMANNFNEKFMYLSMGNMKPGDWTIGVFPRSLQINGINTEADEIKEETVCETKELVFEEGADYQAIYADIKGSGDVYGSIVAEDGRTYVIEIITYKDDNRKEQRYMIYRFPHINAGKYTVNIYHYKSETEISEIELKEYDPQTNELK